MKILTKPILFHLMCVLFFAAGLTGCGQSAPLYMPQDTGQTPLNQNTPAPVTPTQAVLAP
jgi:predicted small lipoprotein YifL